MSASITFTIAGTQAAEFKERIKQEATSKGLSVSELITEALAEYLRKQNDAS